MSCGTRLHLLGSLALCLAAWSAFAAGGPNVYLYDMGSDTSPVWTGFTRVTPATVYDAKRGYGWDLSQGSVPRAVAGEHLDALGVDYISDAAQDPTLGFRQDLPNGEYEVWALTGTVLSTDHLLYPHSLQIQGRDAVAIHPHGEEVFRAVKYEWSRGDDMHDQFVAPRFRWLHGAATVTDGALRIGFTNAKYFPICAVVIAEASVAKNVGEEIRRIELQRKAAFHDIWEEAPVKPGEYAPAASKEEQARGYIVAEVNCLEDAPPGAAPGAGASRSKIELFATPGEQRQASFAVYGLTDLRDVAFDVSDLRAEDGRMIPALTIERGLVRLAPRFLRREPPTYDIHPVLILPARPTFVGENSCKQFWLTLRVPENAVAGVYEGDIRISSLDAPPAALKLRLRVLPFKLVVPPVERYFYFGTMMYMAHPLMGRYDETTYWDSVRAETRYLKDNEFCIAALWRNTMARGPWVIKDKEGKVVDVDISMTDKLMQIVKEEGAWPRDNTMISINPELVNSEYCGGSWKEGVEYTFAPTPADRANFIRAIQIMNEKAKKAGWPEVVFECGGEFGRRGKQGVDYALAVYAALKEAGVSTALRGDGEGDLTVIEKGLVDYPEPAWSLMKKQYFPRVKANSKRLWAYAYNLGRFGYGWFSFKHNITRSGEEGGIYFAYQPGNIFSVPTDFPAGGLPTSLTTFAPSVALKRMVEGADDLKYLYTLDGLIKKGEASGKPAAQTAARGARAWLDERLKTVPDYWDSPRADEGDIGLCWDVNELVSRDRNWQPGDYDKYRWQMAEYIMTLQKELGE